MNMNQKIILEDGQEYYGYAFGSLTNRVCEIVFRVCSATTPILGNRTNG